MEKMVDQQMTAAAAKLNGWLDIAPDPPGGTGRDLLIILRELTGSPLLRLFTGVKDAGRKERFLIAVALTLNVLRTQFRWMVDAENDLTETSLNVRRKFFTVEGQDVMDQWANGRIKKYNDGVGDVVGKVRTTKQGEELRMMLKAAFPKRQADTPDDGSTLRS